VFANAAFFTERLEELVANAGEGLKCVILDAEAISDSIRRRRRRWRMSTQIWSGAASNMDRRANGPLRGLLQVTG